jgi:hypothetical protein
MRAKTPAKSNKNGLKAAMNAWMMTLFLSKIGTTI